MADRRRYSGLVVVFIFEAIIFYSQLVNNVIPFYPPNHDQLVFLMESYKLAADVPSHGWGGLFEYFFFPANARGGAFEAEGALLALIGGLNRTSLLTLNLLYAVAVQSVLFCTVRGWTKSAPLAWGALAMLLASGTFFQFAGGIFDYRFDFAALCLYGIWICLIIWSDQLRNLHRSLVVAAVAILLVATRTITSVYVVAVYGWLLLRAVWLLYRSLDPSVREVAKSQVRNVLLSGFVAALVVVPILIGQLPYLYRLYGIGHVFGDEKYTRAAELGLQSLRGHIEYYPRSLLGDHLGKAALGIGLVLIVAGFIWRAFAKATAWNEVRAALRAQVGSFLFLAVAIVFPLVVLTSDIAKSPVVGGVVTVPAILLVIAIAAVLFPRVTTRTATPAPFWGRPGFRTFGDMAQDTFRQQWPNMLAIVLVVSCAGLFVRHARVNHWTMSHEDLQRINKLNDEITRYVVEANINPLRMSVDRIVDYTNYQVIALTAFEKYGIVLEYLPSLENNSFNAIPRDTAVELVSESDVVILTDPSIGRNAVFPMNDAIEKYWPALEAATLDGHVELFSTQIKGIPYRAFWRPQTKLFGLTGDLWMTSAGIEIEAKRDDIAKFPFIVLSGESNLEQIGIVPKYHAELVGQKPIELPVHVTVDETQYRVVIDATGLRDAGDPSLRIKLTADRWFVPQKLGIDEDPRELVMGAPTSVTLHASAPSNLR